MQLLTWLQQGNMLIVKLLWPKFKIDVFLHRALTGHWNARIIKAGRLRLSCTALLRKMIIRKAKQHWASEIHCYLMWFLMRRGFNPPLSRLVFIRVWQRKIQTRSTHTHKSPNTQQACHEDYLPQPRGLYKFFLNIGIIKATLHLSKQDTAVTHTQSPTRTTSGHVTSETALPRDN